VELSWSTFVLEIVNFLVLVWILKRFLYRPVHDIVARRRARIEAMLDEARREREAGEALQARYEARFADWEKERAAEREKMHGELEAEREREHDALRRELDEERGKARVLAERERAAARDAIEARAVAAGARFATRLLGRVVDPGLEARLVDAAIADLEAAPGEDLRTAVATQAGRPDRAAEVTTAFELDDDRRAALEKTLAAIAGGDVACSYRTDPRLGAGLRLRADAVVVDANLEAELAAFAAAAGGVPADGG